MIPVNIQYANLAIDTRLWVSTASPEQIADMLELGYKTHKLANEIAIDPQITMLVKKIDEQPKILQGIVEQEITKMLTSTNNNTSAVIGQNGEDFIFNTLKQHFVQITDTHDKGKSGDYCINDTMLVEVKNYSTNVPKRETDKFKRDLEISGKLGGVFISLNTPISNIGMFKKAVLNVNGKDIPVVYICTCNKDVVLLACEMILAEIKFYNIKYASTLSDCISIDVVKLRFSEIEQNMMGIINLRNIIKTMTENFNKSTESLLFELTQLEFFVKTNLEIIKKELR